MKLSLSSRFALVFVFLPALLWFGGIVRAQEAVSVEFPAFLQQIRAEAGSRGIRPATVDRALGGLTPDRSVIALTERQSEFVKPIWDYLRNGVAASRIDRGARMASTHTATLAAVEKRFGVDRGILLAIWGMETSFGAFTGDKDVIRSLVSLSYVGYRGQFFRNELMAALEILDRGEAERADMRGSWAGAMGQTQFMPTNFRTYALDFDGDGRRNIWTSVPDVLASTANYLRGHGWQPGLPWGMEVLLPQGFDHRSRTGSFSDWSKRGVRRADGKPLAGVGEARLFYPAGATGPIFLVTANYDVIKRYNSSDSYALAVAHLGDRLKGGGAFKRKWPEDEPQLGQAERVEVQKRLAALGYDVGEPDGRVGTRTREALRDFQERRGHLPDGWPTPKMLQALRTAR
jgi:membrane-bound lytic murein transglycosylase B